MFTDRRDAGRRLAERLERYADREDVLVLALPRGGVPVGFEVARALQVPLDVFLVRKLGVPGHEELAMGAIASGGVRVLNEEVIASLGIPDEAIDRVTEKEKAELARRERQYRGERPLPSLTGRTVLLVDDGLATGATMRAAVVALRRLGPASIVVAVPVGARETCQEFSSVADEVFCARQPGDFGAVGQWYADFEPTSDAEVEDLLSRAKRGAASVPNESHAAALPRTGP